MIVPPPPVLPWFAPIVRQYLLDDADFAATCGGRCSTRAGDVTEPYALIQVTAQPISASAGVWSPLVQVDGWAPPGGELDPEDAVWRIAVAAARRLDRARNELHENCRWTGRVTDGPLTGIDTSRGPDSPLYRAFVRAELTVHAR